MEQDEIEYEFIKDIVDNIPVKNVSVTVYSDGDIYIESNEINGWVNFKILEDIVEKAKQFKEELLIGDKNGRKFLQEH